MRERERERIKSLPCKVLIKVSASLHRSISTDSCRVIGDTGLMRMHADIGVVYICISMWTNVFICYVSVSWCSWSSVQTLNMHLIKSVNTRQCYGDIPAVIGHHGLLFFSFWCQQKLLMVKTIRSKLKKDSAMKRSFWVAKQICILWATVANQFTVSTSPYYYIALHHKVNKLS